MTKKDYSNLPYRICVGITLFNDKGQIFVGERLDSPGAWQMPQGGVDEGETLEDAAFRELYEETGSKSAELIGKMDETVSYDLPDHLIGKMWNGKFKGQIQTWLAMKFTGHESEFTLYGGHYPEFQKWQWIDIDEICDLVIPFKKPSYEKIMDSFRPLSNAIKNK